VKACDRCGEPFTSQRSSARFCSGQCRKRNHEGKPVDRVEPHVLPSAAPVLDARGAVTAVRAELEAAGLVGTYQRAVALALAHRIDTSNAVAENAGRFLWPTLRADRDRITSDVDSALGAVLDRYLSGTFK